MKHNQQESGIKNFRSSLTNSNAVVPIRELQPIDIGEIKLWQVASRMRKFNLESSPIKKICIMENAKDGDLYFIREEDKSQHDCYIGKGTIDNGKSIGLE